MTARFFRLALEATPASEPSVLRSTCLRLHPSLARGGGLFLYHPQADSRRICAGFSGFSERFSQFPSRGHIRLSARGVGEPVGFAEALPRKRLFDIAKDVMYSTSVKVLTFPPTTIYACRSLGRGFTRRHEDTEEVLVGPNPDSVGWPEEEKAKHKHCWMGPARRWLPVFHLHLLSENRTTKARFHVRETPPCLRVSV